MRWARKPPVHFVAIALALFALERYRAAPLPGTARPMVVITAERLAQARAELGPATASEPAPDAQGLVERAVDEEILYREALAHGLGWNDPAVRFRLVEKMRFLVADGSPTDEELYRKAIALGLDRDDAIVRGILVRQMRLLLKRSGGEPTPDDAELRAYLDRHRDEYLEPARVSLWHVFLATDRRGPAAEYDAHALLSRLQDEAIPPWQAVRLGDVFAAGGHLRGQSAQELTRLFGTEFARAVLALEPGAWAGPVRSSYGLHLVKVEAKEPPQTPPLETVRSRVLARLLEERHEAHLAAALAALRAKYAVRVDDPAGGRG
jgi:peptidyl-prolyl cis-trans isomerase C